MEFDKSRVYTALNADELKVGSTVIVANDLRSLRAKVEKFDNSYKVQIRDILSEAAMRRFEAADGYVYVLVYLISPPKEPKKPEYKPFSDTETAFMIIAAHRGWIRRNNMYCFITSLDINHVEEQIKTNEGWMSAKYACDKYVFADDGTPVGEKVEDDDNDAK
ncbi:MAG: hypothetical protein ACTTJ1_01765 [Treponema sp.]